MPHRVAQHDLATFCRACSEGDLEVLAKLLDRQDPIQGFQGDLNEHHGSYCALHYAAVNGQLECVEMLRNHDVDPHMRTRMPQGTRPEDGKTAAELADDWGWDDVVSLLREWEEDVPKGDYLAGGPLNNAKIYPSHLTSTGRAPAEARDVAKQLKAMWRPFFREQDERDPHVGLLFCGQGSQHLGMLGANSETLPGVAEMLRIARRILNWDPVEVCLRGPTPRLQQVATSYPALYIAGAVALQRLKQEDEEAASKPGAVAGLGVGEFTALWAAGVVSFEDGLRLVKAHADALQEAADSSTQALLSVAGVRRRKLEDLCKAVHDEGSEDYVCVVSTELFPKGATCGGSTVAMQRLQKAVEDKGALQARLVEGPALHTPLMASAVPALRVALDEIMPRLKPPTCDIYMNCTGRAVFAGSCPRSLVPLLLRQLTEPVLWESSIKAMIKGGISDFFELGPKEQLKAIMKRIDAGAFARTTSVKP